ncbi:hypothetical protein ACWY4P_36315 [Streptomyces sp. LZ34]
MLRPVAGLIDATPGPQRDAVRGALGLAAPPAVQDRFLVAAGVLSPEAIDFQIPTARVMNERNGAAVRRGRPTALIAHFATA